MKKIFKTISIVIAGLVVMFFYNNCGKIDYQVYEEAALALEEGSPSGSVTCESELLKVYADTWQPVLVESCASCHGYGHGSTDTSTSYSGFTAKGETRIKNNATTSHKGMNFSQNLAIVNSFLPQWEEAKSTFQACSAGAQGEVAEEFEE